MEKCPICGREFKAGEGVKQLGDFLCSTKCAEKAALEGKTVLEPEEGQQAEAGS